MTGDAGGAPLISLRQVGKSFKDGRLLALDRISFDVRPGEFVSLVGPSGCGKTTLLRLINGLIVPDQGEVRVKGAPPVPNSDLAMVFQSARLLPWRTVAGNIDFVLALRVCRAATVPRGPWRCWAPLACVTLPMPIHTNCREACKAGSGWPAPLRSSRRSCLWTNPLPRWTP